MTYCQSNGISDASSVLLNQFENNKYLLKILLSQVKIPQTDEVNSQSIYNAFVSNWLSNYTGRQELDYKSQVLQSNQRPPCNF